MKLLKLTALSPIFSVILFVSVVLFAGDTQAQVGEIKFKEQKISRMQLGSKVPKSLWFIECWPDHVRVWDPTKETTSIITRDSIPNSVDIMTIFTKAEKLGDQNGMVVFLALHGSEDIYNIVSDIAKNRFTVRTTTVPLKPNIVPDLSLFERKSR